ncbi:MAG: RagB/SusD family nutrient uptake outer membrane protein, partial [Bacteroidetes bacterium]|nr:RagB/SusD family nutrient uptake outer membrane protein [Bacteroidota bacterium]
NLANSFKTDAQGLPMPETFMNDYYLHDEGVAADAAFTPADIRFDPRIDHTMGRRGIPYLDWGQHPGAAWIRDQPNGGPYSPKKNVYAEADAGTYTDNSSWTSGLTANNYNLIRFADVLLWAAEAEVEAGSLEKAREYVNMVRARAANPEGWVRNEDGTPAANYVISTYEAAWTDQAMAREAVRFERKLELGMEGHRFFDLVRYEQAVPVLNAYIDKEKEFRQYLRGATFQETDKYFPIPEQQITLSMMDGQPTLVQNPGY